MFLNMVKSEKVSNMSAKDAGFLIDTVKFTGTLSAPLLTAVLNQKFTPPLHIPGFKGATKELQPLINKLISPLRETAQLAMEGGVGSLEFRDHSKNLLR